MNETSASKTANIIYKTSLYLRIATDSPNIIKQSLKYPRHYRAQTLCFKLKILLVKIKRIKSLDVHKTFWSIVSGILRKSICILSGSEETMISRRMPSVPLILKKDERNKNVRSVLKVTDLMCPIPFWFAVPELFQNSTKKVSEGSFAEIYEIKKSNGDKRILKIVAVGDLVPRSREVQLTFKEMSGEISASLELSKLSNEAAYSCSTYPNIYNVSVVQDTFPEAAVAAWKKFNSKHKSDHPCPEHYLMDQAYVAIETEPAGCDLDTFKVKCYFKALSIFQQVAAGLAVAEEKLNFEHRDLHPGNILLKKCRLEEKIEVCLKSEKHSIETCGVKAKIIDFTFSRLKTEDGVKFLKLDAIYNPKPNSSKKFLDHRYVYVKMAEQTKKRWSTFCPRTNVLWLQHILLTLLEKVGKERKSKTIGKGEKAALITLLIHSRTCLLYGSAAEFVREEVLNKV